MSFAIHLFMAEKFSEESYRRFLVHAQNLFGKWDLEETVPFNEDPGYLTIHECWIKAGDVPLHEWFRVNVEACKHEGDRFVWGFDYKWHLRIETGSGPVGLAVQLGGWLLAMHSFRFILALDRDSDLKKEPTEFRSAEAVAEHIRRLLEEEFACSADLRQQGVLSDQGYLLLPPHSRKSP